MTDVFRVSRRWLSLSGKGFPGGIGKATDVMYLTANVLQVFGCFKLYRYLINNG